MTVDLPLHGTSQRAQKVRNFRDKLHPLVIFAQIVFAANGGQLVFHPVRGTFQQQFKPVSTEFLQKFIGILGILNLQNLYLQTCLFQDGNGSGCGVLTGIVTVINQHDLVGIAGHQCRLLFRQTGTEGRNGIVKAILMQ